MEKMARALAMNPSFAPPPHGVLKSLLENPLKLPFHHDDGTCSFSQHAKKLS
ncbi:Hepatic leukemia factor [Liparis tanakae]|uniref:Hepatic leukemia factor n=1 Tax=Liparis tanakae TaxID=230148 RepID=A0A4Z2EMT6_9TELE|nr:Hepatic leukemia factor [Liparis tanakae]